MSLRKDRSNRNTIATRPQGLRIDDNSDPVRILHLTDPHLFADPEGSLRGTNTAQSLEAVLDHYRKGDWRADFAVATGDLVQDDSAGAYQRFRDLLGGIDLPVYCLPGNHDVRALMRQTLSEPPFHYCKSVAAGDWTLILLDSCVSGSAGGQLGEEEFERLAGELAQLDTRYAVVALHHPPVKLGSRWLDSVGLANGDELLTTLSEYEQVQAVLFGHAHQEYRGKHLGIDVIGTPSTCRQFKPGSDKFAVDDNPPAYRKIELLTDGGAQADVVWVGHS